MQVLWTLDSVHPDYHRLVEWRLHLEAPLKHLLLYYSDFAEKDGLKEYKEFLDHLVALDIALHYSSLQRLPKLTLFLTQYPSDGVDLGPSVADATRYAHANTFRLCKAKHLQLQLIWGFVQPEGRVQTYLSSTADGIMRSWSRPPPDLAHPPLSWAWTPT
ncbi:hypothetical protein ONZ51_g7981 [Trametes cubensis]|uniref:Uncharacterized protein n=1 Tax=Trametes cubensis TaxID=1111947 RepID=A0AAD7TRL8_9APHY|nr:hypothetical protein ONZ51_g7981 [Trametes cubensis]